jgi:predicted naringenin-chalcone synthase
MAEYLQYVAPVVPVPWYPQDTARKLMGAWIGGDRRTDRLLARIYQHSGIERRHSVLEDFLEGAPPALAGGLASPLAPARAGGGFFSDDAGGLRNPGTAERNDRYRSEAGPLFVEAGRQALAGAIGHHARDVTHVVTVSCTGFYAPRPDLDVVHGLGLAPSVERYHLGFMGCYAAFPALRMARAFCRADRNAVVLIAAVELCSLHLQPSRDVDTIVAASVFADGAVGAVVSARPPTGPALRLDAFHDDLAPEGASDMAWTLGDQGFRMVLSSYVPSIVGAKAESAIAPLLSRSGLDRCDVGRWAVHPGGRAILDRLEDGLELEPDALSTSRRVLAEYGNMSSVTVLFVLAECLAQAGQPDEPIVAVAFGPGLTVASGLLRRA